MTARPRVGYLNPLTRTLGHYVRELDETLERVGALPAPVREEATEGERGARGKVLMARRGLGNVRRTRRHDVGSVVLWPMFGLYDVPFLSYTRRPAALILHDPSPITDQVDYGRLARRVARAVPPGRAPLVVVHSGAAERDARQILPRARMVRVLHPILSEQRAPAEKAPVALVAGQYKPSRDVALLEDLGPRLRERGIEPLVVGRGWSGRLGPAWRVEDRFVPDDELDELMATAAAMVIPYQRYYQSGVAIRALELGTASVGLETPFLRDVFGAASSVLRSDATVDDFVGAVVDLAEHGGSTTSDFEDYKRAVDESWRQLIPILTQVGDGVTS